MDACSSLQYQRMGLPASTITLSPTPYAALLPSPTEMAALDASAIAAMSHLFKPGSAQPGLVLMERAGKATAQFLRKHYRTQLLASGAVILCGPGNNGGDGLVIARYLRAWGFMRVQVVVCAAERYSADFLAQLSRLKPSRLPVRVFAASDAISPGVLGTTAFVPCSEGGLRQMLAKTSLVVDALLGTGQKSPPQGNVGAAIQVLEGVIAPGSSNIHCVAVDIPSGMNAQTGEVYSPHVTAQATVSMELIKRGMLQYPGRSICGEMVAVGIGIEPTAKVPIQWKLTVAQEIWVPRRLPASHKGDNGHVYVVAGSTDMPGAALLASRAAARAGAGLVTTLRFKSQLTAAIPPEILQHVLSEGNLEANLAAVLERMRRASCTVLGPGIGVGPEAISFVQKLLEASTKEKLPMVLDADALTILAKLLKQGMKLDLSSAILTPHPGEMGRLLDLPTAEVQRDRYAAAEQLHALSCAVVVLKGASTVVFSKSAGFVNPTGNPGMATGGSGDVLCGVIAALVAQKCSLCDAARSGVYLHGLAGDLAQNGRSVALMAGDIIDRIPDAVVALWKMNQLQMSS